VYKADQVLSSLEHFKPEDWGLPPYDDDDQAGADGLAAAAENQ
jgi:hypothetical protein